MKKVFISKNYRDRYTASSKAKMDVEEIAKRSGFKNIGLPQTVIRNRLGQLLTYLSNWLGILRMPSNGIVLCQYPIYGLDKIILRAKKKCNKIVVVIHDINKLRNEADNSLDPLYEADIIIAHNEMMKNWLIANGIKKDIRILQIFDYLSKGESAVPDYPSNGCYNICFAGNLGKSKFLNELKIKSNKIKLFGIGRDNIYLNDNVYYEGTFLPDVLRFKLNSHFGLVWDGKSCNTCEGINGEYLKYIAPHKLSMYLSSNIPVIVWDQSAMAGYVKKNNIGITVENLNQLDNILQGITESQYKKMVENVKIEAEKIRSGEHLKSILTCI